MKIYKWSYQLLDHAVVAGTAPAGYEEYIPSNKPRLLAPMMPDIAGATVYDFTFDKVCLCTGWAAALAGRMGSWPMRLCIA